MISNDYSDKLDHSTRSNHDKDSASSKEEHTDDADYPLPSQVLEAEIGSFIFRAVMKIFQF
jgi:hypothetical protein